MPFDAVELHGSKVRVKTPREPRTGVRDLLMDPLDWIHAVALQVPDPSHCPAARPAPARVAGPVCCAGFWKWIRSSVRAAGWR